jgi:hypothetical protein
VLKPKLLEWVHFQGWAALQAESFSLDLYPSSWAKSMLKKKKKEEEEVCQKVHVVLVTRCNNDEARFPYLPDRCNSLLTLLLIIKWSRITFK